MISHLGMYPFENHSTTKSGHPTTTDEGKNQWSLMLKLLRFNKSSYHNFASYSSKIEAPTK